jgi:hypothetical protein
VREQTQKLFNGSRLNVLQVFFPKPSKQTLARRHPSHSNTPRRSSDLLPSMYLSILACIHTHPSKHPHPTHRTPPDLMHRHTMGGAAVTPALTTNTATISGRSHLAHSAAITNLKITKNVRYTS